MRDIKFRAKDKDGKWLYGGIHKHIDFTPFALYKTEEERNKDISEHTHYLILQDGFSDYGMPRRIDAHEVDEDTIGQFIGLNDRNGKEIYEGDILRLWRENGKEYGVLLSVKYCNLWCAFVVEDKPMKEQYIIWKDFLEWEIVGNIHDNPELLNL